MLTFLSTEYVDMCCHQTWVMAQSFLISPMHAIKYAVCLYSRHYIFNRHFSVSRYLNCHLYKNPGLYNWDSVKQPDSQADCLKCSSGRVAYLACAYPNSNAKKFHRGKVEKSDIITYRRYYIWNKEWSVEVLRCCFPLPHRNNRICSVCAVRPLWHRHAQKADLCLIL